MKANVFQSLYNRLLPQLPGFACRGKLIFSVPIGHVLRGFCFEDSDFDNTSFYVNVFFLPLYVPTKHIHFAFGRRLRFQGGDRWSINNASLEGKLLDRLQSEGIPFLSGVEEPLRLAEVAQQRYANSQDPYVLEAIAYSLLMGDDEVSSQAALDRFLAVLNPTVAWQTEMKRRAEELKRLDLQGAKHLLAEWEAVSRINLRIQD